MLSRRLGLVFARVVSQHRPFATLPTFEDSVQELSVVLRGSALSEAEKSQVLGLLNVALLGHSRQLSQAYYDAGKALKESTEASLLIPSLSERLQKAQHLQAVALFTLRVRSAQNLLEFLETQHEVLVKREDAKEAKELRHGKAAAKSEKRGSNPPKRAILWAAVLKQHPGLLVGLAEVTGWLAHRGALDKGHVLANLEVCAWDVAMEISKMHEAVHHPFRPVTGLGLDEQIRDLKHRDALKCLCDYFGVHYTCELKL